MRLRSLIEVRYVGIRRRDGWTTYNDNEANIVETGLLGGFRAAQANLWASIAASRGATFRYFEARMNYTAFSHMEDLTDDKLTGLGNGHRAEKVEVRRALLSRSPSSAKPQTRLLWG